jgi:hypothetical protein
MTIYVHRPDTPKEAPPPALGKNFGHLHNASGGQLGCLIALLSVVVLFVIVVVSDNNGSSAEGSTLGFVVIGAVTAVVLLARRTDRQNVATRGPVVLAVNADHDDERRVEQIAADATRFGIMVERAGLTAASGRELGHVGWVVWHAGIRVNRLGEISSTIRNAGSRVTGPAKAAWLREREAEMVALRKPVIEAGQQLSDLADIADLAEDVVYAAALARESGVGPGELYGTLGLDLPQPFDVTAADAIEEATDRLRGWHRTWVELDEALRAAGEAARRRRNR